MRCTVTGGSGFIGHHLVNYLSRMGFWVRSVDKSNPQYTFSADEVLVGDLRETSVAAEAVSGADWVFHLAAEIGGIPWITSNLVVAATDNVVIDVNMLKASITAKVNRFFYASSACVYNVDKQDQELIAGLVEADAWPAKPEPAYGLEKLYAEELCSYFFAELGLDTRIARFHNVAGPEGTYTGGREKAPAALCRKVASAESGGTISIFGDGLQTRSFLCVDDCVEGIYRIMKSDYREPLNLGSDRLVTVKDLADMIVKASGKELHYRYDLSAPQGVRGRNSDNTMLLAATGWVPPTPMEEWVPKLYAWIKERVDEDAFSRA